LLVYVEIGGLETHESHFDAVMIRKDE